MSSVPPDKAGDGHSKDVPGHNEGGSEPPASGSAGAGGKRAPGVLFQAQPLHGRSSLGSGAQLAKVLGTSPVLLPKKLKTKHQHVTDQCLATTELAREVALLRTNWE